MESDLSLPSLPQSRGRDSRLENPEWEKYVHSPKLLPPIEEQVGSTLPCHGDVEALVVIEVGGSYLKPTSNTSLVYDVLVKASHVFAPLEVVDTGWFFTSRIVAVVGIDALTGDQLVISITIEVCPVKAMGLGETVVDQVLSPVQLALRRRR